jgi:thiol-disulfide isomerase/thioredoxin
VPILRGQVLNHVGGGIGKVEVIVRIPRGTADPDRQTDVVAQAFTDDMGDFVVTAEQRIPGPLVAQLKKAGYAEITRDVEPGREGKVPFLDVEMQGGLKIKGQVREIAEHNAVKHARILVRSAYKELTGESDEEGRFEVTEVLPGPAELIVEADGFGRHREEIRAAEDLEPLSIELKPQRIVHLKIVDEHDEPIAGVTVEVLDQPHDDFRTQVTDASGKADFRGLHFEAETLALRLTHERYAGSAEFDRSIELPSDAVESSHTLTMTPAGIVSGIVRDAVSGEPLGGARVIAGNRITARMPMTWTDFEGRFKLTGVPPGEVPLTVHLAGHAPGLKVVEIKPLEEAQAEIMMPARATAGGVVVDGNGKPIKEAYVWTTRWRGFETLGLQSLTDEEGRFEIANAPADEFELVIMASGYEPCRGNKLCAGQKDAKFTLTAAHGGADKDQAARAGPRAGEAATNIEVITLEGKKLALDKLRGKVVLLDFWATWCGPCVGEVPNLVKVHEAFGTREDFVMLSVSLDQDERALRDFVQKRKMTWNHACGEDGGADKAADTYGVSAIPALFVINREGKIAASGLRGGEIKNQVQKALDAGSDSRRRKDE